MPLWSSVSHLHGVADTPELRAAHAEGQQRLVENNMKVGQNRDLYDVLVALSVSPGFADLAPADRVAVEHAIRDFALSGVALEPEARERFKAISVELFGAVDRIRQRGARCDRGVERAHHRRRRPGWYIRGRPGDVRRGGRGEGP